MLAPLLRLSRPTLRESNALAQSPCVKEPRNADTNGEVRRAWMARIRERQLRVQNRPERCGHEVCGGLNRRSSMCLTPLESGMPTRPKGDAHWQREGNETAWIIAEHNRLSGNGVCAFANKSQDVTGVTLPTRLLCNSIGSMSGLV